MVIAYRVLVAALALVKAGAGEKEVPFAAVDAAYGFDSSVTAPQASIARDAAAWDRLWATHRGTSGARLPGNVQIADDKPAIDFGKHLVVAIFGGTTEGVEGYSLVEAVTDAKKAYVRFLPMPPEIPLATPRVSQPYGFAVLTRTKKPIEVQISVGPDKWRTVATFQPAGR